MASPIKPLPRRLSELLEEEQEPFLLDVYLLENGFSRRAFKSKATCTSWSWSRKNHGFRRREKAGIFRVTLTKLAYWKNIKKSLNRERFTLVDCFSELRSKINAMGFLRLSSSRSTNEGETLHGENGSKDVEHSPVSVLELDSDDASYDNNHLMEEKNPPTPTLDSPTTEPGFVHFSPLPQNGENKREQLHSPKRESWESCDILGKMTNGRIMGDSWELYKLSAIITHLIELDLSETRSEWSHFHAERREIGREIESIIIEEMREESFLDMLGFHYTLETYD